MKRHLFCFLLLAALSGLSTAETSVSIIPQPAKMELSEGFFEINRTTLIIAADDLQGIAGICQQLLSPAMGYPLTVKIEAAGNFNRILLKCSDSLAALGSEGYQLTVTSTEVRIEALEKAGLFYGNQTLRQLLPADLFGNAPSENTAWRIPCVKIEDQPRFRWRGMHLDVGRHFMPVEYVKKYIDLIALHKMNIFHWHLTDDQGWRIEIKKYPKLTEIGAWRKETVVGKNSETYDGKPHGGFYTQDEIRQIVQYAKERYVTIVPEIEMPGHSIAALAAYPELSCTGGPFEVVTHWGVFRHVYCAGNDQVFLFNQDILDEVMELFSSPYIHIGGDECPKENWKSCRKCQERIKAEGLKDENELQSYFIKRIETYLNEHGRRIIGWDEILEGGVAPNATVMSWRGMGGGIAAARANHDVIIASNSHLYFDYYQANPEKEPLSIGGFVPLEKVYSLDPIPAELTQEQAKHILGVQAQVWTEYIQNPQQADYMAYPRGCALAEIAWTPLGQKNYEDFYRRLTTHTERLRRMNVNFRPLDAIGQKVGTWSSGQTSEEYQPMSWELTPLLKASGTYQIAFHYTSGAHRLDIQSVEILENETVISHDRHWGTTGGRNENNTYTFSLPEFKDESTYILRASVRSDGGTDSNGGIYLFKK
jgi:hexosaminidase